MARRTGEQVWLGTFPKLILNRTSHILMRSSGMRPHPMEFRCGWIDSILTECSLDQYIHRDHGQSIKRH